MKDLENKNTSSSQNSSNVLKNLPKKLPPDFLRNHQSKATVPPNLPKKLPTNLAHKRTNVNINANTAQTKQCTSLQTDANKQKSLNELLEQNYDTNRRKEKVENVARMGDNEYYKAYTKSVANYRKALKRVKKPVALSDLVLKPVKNVFFGDIPEILWFYSRSRVKAIAGRIDLTLSYRAPRRKGVLTAIIILILIMAIIGSGVYIAYILTRNLNPQDTEVVGEITFSLEDVEHGGSATTKLSISGARLNKDLVIHPTITNNTNIELYLRFYVTLEYIYGKDYLNVDINDLSVSYPLDEQTWWTDPTDTYKVGYYMFKLAPKEKITLFDSFQINGASNIENDWQGKSLNAIVHAEVCQVLSSDQTFPPGWSTYWAELITNTSV